MATDPKTILGLTVPVIVQIGHKRALLGEVLKLAPGAILELPKAADEDLDLCINNKAVGTGTAVKVAENFGLRIGDIRPIRDRAEAVLEG